MTDITLFNCYEVLKAKTDSEYNEIKSAFRALSKQAHPDITPDGSAEEQIRLNLAYEILMDPVLRIEHDRFWIKAGSRNDSRKPRESDLWKETGAGLHTGSPAEKKSRNSRSAEHDGRARFTRSNSARTRTGDMNETNEKKEPAGTRAVPTSYETVIARVRKAIREKENEIESSRNERKKKLISGFTELFKKKRFLFVIKSVFVIASISGGIFFPLFFLFSLLLAAVLLVPDARVHVEYDSIFVLALHWKKRIERAVKIKVDFSIAKERDSLSGYTKILKLMKEEVTRGSRERDNETAVAGRLALAFFFMGYVPADYEPKTRTIRFTVSSDTVLVRYRHRAGTATNIAYVKKLADSMHSEGATSGFIFSSPGLSGKALLFAKNHNIASYTLKEMNDWMRNVYASGHSGPADSILDALDTLSAFIRGLAGAV
jgi:curved DNA-binding protein CbpA